MVENNKNSQFNTRSLSVTTRNSYSPISESIQFLIKIFLRKPSSMNLILLDRISTSRISFRSLYQLPSTCYNGFQKDSSQWLGMIKMVLKTILSRYFTFKTSFFFAVHSEIRESGAEFNGFFFDNQFTKTLITICFQCIKPSSIE